MGLNQIYGINNFQGVILTGQGKDLISAEASGTDQAFGIFNDGGDSLINTGSGDDEILGEVNDSIGLQDSGFIAGIYREFGFINTGKGADLVRGTATASNSELPEGGQVAGINSFGKNFQRPFDIQLGAGDDQLMGSAISFGPQDTAGIVTQGLFGNQIINLGTGNDFVEGFGQSSGGFLTGGIALFATDLVSASGNNKVLGIAGGGSAFNSGIALDSDSVIELNPVMISLLESLLAGLKTMRA